MWSSPTGGTHLILRPLSPLAPSNRRTPPPSAPPPPAPTGLGPPCTAEQQLAATGSGPQRPTASNPARPPRFNHRNPRLFPSASENQKRNDILPTSHLLLILSHLPSINGRTCNPRNRTSTDFSTVSSARFPAGPSRLYPARNQDCRPPHRASTTANLHYRATTTANLLHRVSTTANFHHQITATNLVCSSPIWGSSPSNWAIKSRPRSAL